jgi:1-acyl-sn-glycerol-3-phosphate acyltransferase
MKGVVTIFRLIGGVLAILAFGIPTLLLRPFDRSGRIFNAFGRGWARTILWICGIHISVRGLENIEPGSHYIYVSNHASMFDIPAVMAGIPDQVRIVYKQELERVPVFGWIMKYSPYITIDRQKSFSAMRSLELAAERIKYGTSVLLFAEGTRSEHGRLQPFKRGAFSLAVRADKQIVPVTINGSYDRRPKGAFVINPGTIELVVEKPIPTDEGSGKEYEVALMNRVADRIRAHFREPVAA